MNFEEKKFKRIAVAVDFSSIDEHTLRYALSIGGADANYLLIHVVESAGALLLGDEIRDQETSADMVHLKFYAEQLSSRNIKVETYLGFGNPKTSIPQAVRDFEADLLVLGAHGHRLFKDLIFGTTVDSVRHNVQIPVFIVREDD
ncbi:MAG: universal stress protein [Bacteroidetes bacterium]|nr:MAG: universal stress protein [Bacteroidota bacterium]